MAWLESVRTSRGLSDAPGRKDTDEDAERDSDNRQPACVPLHLVHAAVSFVARFLHDNGPVQILTGL